MQETNFISEANFFITHALLFISLYFEIFLLATFLEKWREIWKKTENPILYPTVTVIVPGFNEEKTIAKTVNSLLSLDYPKEKLSIFLVDDGSTDSTWSVMQQFKENPMITLLQKENGGKHTALNLAIKNSSSEIVGCLDADSFVDRNALKRIVLRFENKNVQAVTPAIQINNPRNGIELIQSAEYMFSAFIRKVFSFLGSIYITPGPFSFFRREVFEKIGPYRKAHNTEDLEIALRLQLNHFRIDNAHDAYVYTTAPKTIRALYKQRVRWTHGFLENAKDYRSLFFSRSHGNLSLFILPTVTISIFTAIYFTGFFLLTALSMINNKIIEISAVGFGLSASLPRFDWFFIRTESVFILSLMLVLLTITLMMTGRYILDGRIRFSRGMFLFTLLYSFLAPFWLVRSVYNVALSKKTSWR